MAHEIQKILVIDDNQLAVDDLVNGLLDEGHEALGTTDPIEALRCLARAERQDLPDVILLDYEMPKMDGLVFRKKQLADPYLAGIRTVLCTGADTAEVLKAFEGTSIEIIRKPIDMDQLRTMLRL